MIGGDINIEWHHQIKDTGSVIPSFTGFISLFTEGVTSRRIPYITNNNDIICAYNGQFSSMQIIRYDGSTGDTIWHVTDNSLTNSNKAGTMILGVDATEQDVVIAANRHDNARNGNGGNNGYYEILTYDTETGALLDSLPSDSLYTFGSNQWYRFDPIDRVTGKHVHLFYQDINYWYLDTITGEWSFSLIDTFATLPRVFSTEWAGWHNDPPKERQDSFIWRIIKDSMRYDHSFSSSTVKSHDQRSLIGFFQSPEADHYRSYVLDYNYDTDSFTRVETTDNWYFTDGMRVRHLYKHPQGFLMQTEQIYELLDSVASGYIIVDHDYNIIRDRRILSLDGLAIRHLVSLPVPDSDQILHIGRRNEMSDVVYYIEEADGSTRKVGHLTNHNDPVYAFLPADHTWDREGNLIGHFQVRLDSITVFGQKFNAGNWLFLYKVNKEQLSLNTSTFDHTSSTADIILYPNPGASQFSVRANIDYTAVDIYSMSGQRLLTVNRTPTTINVDDLSPGIYHIVLRDATHIVGQAQWVKVE